jgi:hypothetical protein
MAVHALLDGQPTQEVVEGELLRPLHHALDAIVHGRNGKRCAAAEMVLWLPNS